MEIGLASGEAMAHLNHLLARGELAVELDSDGAWRFSLQR
jgi:hypothetical protein